MMSCSASMSSLWSHDAMHQVQGLSLLSKNDALAKDPEIRVGARP